MNERVTFQFDVNGLSIEAIYSKKAVHEIFIPLLQRLTKLQRQLGRRLIVYLVAPPAVGKSTLASFLEYLSKQDSNLTPIQSVGLDGFHYHQDYLESHTMIRDGKEVMMSKTKGCSQTYDVDKLVNTLERFQSNSVLWPIYSRVLHDVVEDQIKIQEDIILIEGNWLLLNDERWKQIDCYCDYSIFIQANPDQLKERLIKRKMMGGFTEKEATDFYEKSDSYNVIDVLKNSRTADLTLVLNENQDFEQKGEECYEKL